MAGKLVLIIGSSGVGKSVILQSLKERNPELHFPKSATTREKREGEGNDLYHFVSNEEFDQLEQDNKILEYAVVHGKEKYGTLVDEIIPYIDKGRIVVREVDVQGFDSIRKHRYFRPSQKVADHSLIGDERRSASANTPSDYGRQAADYRSRVYPLQSIFILPESKAQLIAHITDRAPISDEELNRRIASMENELDHAPDCDVQIINKEGKLEESIEEVERAIFTD